MTSADSRVRTVTNEDQHRLARVLADFEKTWDAGALAAQVVHLPPVGQPLRLLALAGMVKIDLRLRWRQGKAAPLEEYLQQYPELGTRDTIAADLIYGWLDPRVGHAS